MLSVELRAAELLPTPCGEWGAAIYPGKSAVIEDVTDPLRGVDCSEEKIRLNQEDGCYRPLAGSGLQH